MSERIGFVGVGKMGAPMVRRLLAAGHHLHLHDVSEAALGPFRGQAKVTMEPSPRAVAGAVPLVFTSLPSPAVTEAVSLGEDGIAAAGPGRTVVDLSTTGVPAARAIGARLEAAGLEVLDAPVSGGPAGAEKGTLAIMVAGRRDLFERHREVLGRLGTHLFWVGPSVGQGQAMKLVNNMLSATAMAATSEAMVVATRAGISPKTALDVINVSSGMNTATRDKFPRDVVTRKFDYGFATHLMYKDVKLFQELAESLEVPTFVTHAVAGLWRFAMSQGGGPTDFTTIVRYFEEWGKTEVGGRGETE